MFGTSLNHFKWFIRMKLAVVYSIRSKAWNSDPLHCVRNFFFVYCATSLSITSIAKTLFTKSVVSQWWTLLITWALIKQQNHTQKKNIHLLSTEEKIICFRFYSKPTSQLQRFKVGRNLMLIYYRNQKNERLEQLVETSMHLSRLTAYH